MIVGGRDFSDIYDLVGIRVLVEEDRDCYAVLGVLHSRWNPVLGRFKDYVAMPKFNMYQSLHTTVIGPQGKPVELQIRTYAMHRRAEYGVAAHWKYKEDGRAGVDTDRPGDVDDMTWVRQLLDWQNEVEDPGEFLESLRFEINRAEVYVFTPRGDVIALPAGCDAGRLRLRRAHRGRPPHHRRPRQRAAGAARVRPGERRRGRGLHLQVADGRAVARLARLREVAARPLQDPPVVHQGAPRGGDRPGKEQIAKLMRKEGLPLKRLMSHESLMLAAVHFKLADVSALYAAVGEGNLSAQAVVRRVIDLHGGDDGAAEDLAEGVTITGRRGRSKVRRRRRLRRDRQGCARRLGEAREVLHAGAARPDPRLRHQGRGSVGAPAELHQRRQPAVAARAAARRRVGADRSVQLPGQHPGRGARPGAAALRHHDGALRRARRHPQRQPLDHRDRVAKSRFTFEMAEAKHLDTVLKAVRSVPGVFDAYRVTQ